MEKFECKRCRFPLEGRQSTNDLTICVHCDEWEDQEEGSHDCTNGGTEDWCDDCNPYLQ